MLAVLVRLRSFVPVLECGVCADRGLCCGTWKFEVRL
jgi:hypothetical protein